jgi:uncharacterized protein YdaU (DUF1376 family)
MSDLPWYKRYGQNFVFGTIGMSLELRGAYSILLDLIYDRNGPIEDDPAFFKRVMGTNRSKWERIRDELIDLGKITLEDGMISNAKAEKEIAKRAEFSEERAESGRKGGRKLPETEQKVAEKLPETEQKLSKKPPETASETKENNDLDEAQLAHIELEEDIELEEPPVIPLEDQFEEWWNAFPRGRKRAKGRAQKKYTSIINSGRAPPDVLLRGAMRLAAALGDDHEYVPMPTTWLNDERWKDDDIADPARTNGKRPDHDELRERMAGAVTANLERERTDADGSDIGDPGRREGGDWGAFETGGPTGCGGGAAGIVPGTAGAKPRGDGGLF